MNAISQFEESARSVWKANLEPSRKAKKLMTISKAIDDYVARVQETGPVKGKDEWSDKAVERAIDYLAHLSKDVRQLAEDSRVLVLRDAA